MDKYNIYTKEDFLEDEDFVRHIKYPENDNIERWRRWRKRNPPNAHEYDIAVLYLRGILSLVRLHPKEADYADRLYQGIERDIDSREQRQRSRKIFRQFLSGAAAVFLIASVAIWYYSSDIVIQTGNGEHQTAILPDSSTVQLHANSSIAYRRAWSLLGKREVRSEGEVFFDVRHLGTSTEHDPADVPFTVHTGDVNIQVLGTKFNVKNRENRIHVALLEGKIILNTREAAIPMRAGDIISIEHGKVQQTQQNLERVKNEISWKENRLTAENTSVRHLIDEFKYIYGRQIIIPDSSLLNKQISGRISLRSAENVVFSLANILNADIREKQDTIYLYTKENSKLD